MGKSTLKIERYRFILYLVVFGVLYGLELFEYLMLWAMNVNVKVASGETVGYFEERIAVLLCSYFGHSFQYLFLDSPIFSLWIENIKFVFANASLTGLSVSVCELWGIVYPWLRCVLFDGCVAIGKESWVEAPKGHQVDHVKSFSSVVALGVGIRLTVPMIRIAFFALDKMTVYAGARIVNCALSSVKLLPPPPRFDLKAKLRTLHAMWATPIAVSVLRPGVEEVYTPLDLPGSYTFGIETHASPFKPFEMEDEVWARKAVSFWMVDSKGGTIKPIGFAAVVSDALLTNKHVYYAIGTAIQNRMTVYLSAVRREVKSTTGMVEFNPTCELGPSDRLQCSSCSRCLHSLGAAGAATVMGTLMYGAGHVWAGRANFYLHDHELCRSSSPSHLQPISFISLPSPPSHLQPISFISLLPGGKTACLSKA